MNLKQNDARFFVVGLVLGIVLLALFCGLTFALGLEDGYYGMPPRAVP